MTSSAAPPRPERVRMLCIDWRLRLRVLRTRVVAGVSDLLDATLVDVLADVLDDATVVELLADVLDDEDSINLCA